MWRLGWLMIESESGVRTYQFKSGEQHPPWWGNFCSHILKEWLLTLESWDTFVDFKLKQWDAVLVITTATAPTDPSVAELVFKSHQGFVEFVLAWS